MAILTFTRRQTRYGAVEYAAPLPEPVHGDPYYRNPETACVEAVLWYDRGQRLWTGWLADRNGYQSTAAEYAVTRTDGEDALASLWQSLRD